MYSVNKNLLIVLTGAVIGLSAALLVRLGNPPNMGYCIVCFVRDIAGALGLHRAATVQYLRPEILGLGLGAFLSAVIAGEFRVREGSAPFIRFLLGMFMMIGALVFLGCPLRAILRLAGGDLNAVAGLLGFFAGVAFGTQFLKAGFNLGRAHPSRFRAGGYAMPLIMIALLVLVVFKPVFNAEAGGPVFFSAKPPGSLHAPLVVSLVAGLIGGALAQRARLCLSAGFRDLLLVRDTYLLKGYGLIFLAALVANLFLGQFHLGFADQPVAHTSFLWNFLGLFLTGVCAVLLGGCPLRQIVLWGEGDGDAGLAFSGMLVGAGVAHNFMLASSPAGPTLYGQIAVGIGLAVAVAVGLAYREA
ncbi:MAG: YedE family putative selenium transporter [Clostridia bacterium]|jgi:YedE family putative selenium metabolism protein|nr:YedE family putative selenium transporter [Clostridia bacterium]MDH7572620.1 YedE family putative selenium transporter [Clostridia bacterium]